MKLITDAINGRYRGSLWYRLFEIRHRDICRHEVYNDSADYRLGAGYLSSTSRRYA